MHCKKIVAVLTSALLTLPPGLPTTMAQESRDPAAAIGGGEEFSFEDYRERMARMNAFLADLRANLDRTVFEFDALVASLNYDSKEIIEFSRHAIAYEQYPGVLRGPFGTLLSRAGNSIDQALLLAQMLRDAGYDARIAGTELDPEAAQAVLRAMQQPVQPAPLLGDANRLLDVVERHALLEASLGQKEREAFAERMQTVPPAAASDVYVDVVATSDFLQAQLKEAGATLGAADADVALVDEARQYYWVQYRDGPADSWADIHPAFVDELPFAPPQASTYISGAVPEGLLHTFRFQVFIERKYGDELQVLPVTTPWEAPVANLIGVPLTFTNVANGMLNPTWLNRDLADVLSSSRSFIPAINGVMAAGAEAFDLRGTLIEPVGALDMGSDFFATVGDAFASAIGALGGSEAIPTLTAQWLEFTLIAPGGDEQVFRRTTFDRIGAAARRDRTVPADLKPTTPEHVYALTQHHTFMIATGAVPNGYVAESASRHLQDSGAAIDLMMNRRFDRPMQTASLSQVPTAWPGHLALLSLFDMAGTIGPSHRNYRSGPALVIHSNGLFSSEKWVESVDIVSNPRRAVDIRGAMPTLDPVYVIQGGVWETAVEGALLTGDPSGRQRFSTWQAFATAERDGIEPVILLPGQPRPSLALSADTHAAIDADLAKGYAVIIPGAESSAEPIGWWRVDPRTGETLGQLGDGRGQATEGLILILGAISIGLSLYSYSQCEKLESDKAYLCCLLTVGVLSGTGTGIGEVLAARSVEASARLAFAFGYEVGGLIAPTNWMCEFVTK